MASLNTLRTRGGVIVSVVIGIALFAFLLGDFMSSGGSYMDARKMEVGEINGSGIGYVEYSNIADKFTQVAKVMSNRETLSDDEQLQTQNMAWESLMLQHSYNPGFKELGLSLGDDEMLDMVNGEYRSPVITGFFSNPETGLFEPMMVKNFVASLDLDPTGRTALMWGYLKDQMNNERQMSKYLTLITNGVYVTDLEVEHSVTAANTTYTASCVSQRYSSIEDSTINVSDAEIKEYYTKHENSFQQGESRDIEYVTFNLLPSPKDYADAAKYIAEIAVEFGASKDPMQYAALNSHSSINNRYYKSSELEDTIAVTLFNNPDAIYGPVLRGDKYTISRLSHMKDLPDSLGARHILMLATDQEIADSLVNVLKSGGDFAELSAQYSVDKSANATGGDLGVFAPEQMIPEFSDACIVRSVNDIFTVTTSYGIHIVELTKKSKPTAKAQIATISYDIEPSAETQQTIYGQASQFIASASESYDAFNRTATESALSKRVARITNDKRNLPGFDNARELVRWAFNEEQNAVSSIMEIDGDYLVAALTVVSEAGLAPINQVSTNIRSILMQEKKAQIISDNMKGFASLDAAASSIGEGVVKINELKFNEYYIDSLGYEPKLVGSICGGAAKGSLSKPVDGGDGVFLFEVNNVVVAEDVTAESERVLLEASAQNYIMQRVNMVLFEGSEVVDMRVKFF